jgi:hypothetical protein
MKNWELGVMLSDEGFEGIQFIEAPPEARRQIFDLLPTLRPIFMELGRVIRREKGNEAPNLRNI